MKTARLTQNKFWMGLSPWIIIGAVGVLFPIFAFIAVENVNRQKENSIRLLTEKGAALIRSFEAGTRTGMGMHWTNRQLQRLLTETAQQPDIEYLLVADTSGTILAHNNPAYIGNCHGTGLDLQSVAKSEVVQWRIVEDSNGKRIFEVFRKFEPTGPNRPSWMPHRHMMGMMFRRAFRAPVEGEPQEPEGPVNIFVGLDMTSMDAALKSDTRHFLIMVMVLLLVGFAGIILLFLFQSYRATQASLSRIKAFSDTLVENMPIGLVAVDTQKNIASINAFAESLLHLTGQKVVGKAARNILPDDLCKQVEMLDQQDGLIEKEFDCTLPDGSKIPLSISAAVLKDESGSSQGYVLLLRDLSEVKSLRQEVERSRRLATVGRLAAGVAHEIRNPLSSIKGFATYFKERYRDIPEDQQTASIMVQEVDRLNRVVSQLLEFARPLSISKKPTSIKSLIEDSLKLVQRQAAEKNITIHTRLSTEPHMVYLDSDKMNQVFLNLYLNAIDAMEKGGELFIELERNGKKNQLEIKITDTGAGIKETDMAHIFDPYFTTKASGTGLGLAIAHKIIESHNGEIYATSIQGKGTTFTIILPYLLE
ncbi:MAG: PAS domain S-box protein [Deltaproteobacteria bacterium]|nr:PAS domain S-box protein [Deltaproteobacteria bacterium]